MFKIAERDHVPQSPEAMGGSAVAVVRSRDRADHGMGWSKWDPIPHRSRKAYRLTVFSWTGNCRTRRSLGHSDISSPLPRMFAGQRIGELSLWRNV